MNKRLPEVTNLGGKPLVPRGRGPKWWAWWLTRGFRGIGSDPQLLWKSERGTQGGPQGPRVGPGTQGESRGLRAETRDSVSLVTQSCLTLCDHMDCSTPGLERVHYQLPEFTQTRAIESVMPSNHLILCRALLLPPSMFSSTRVFSNESVLCIRWPKYWNFSFSISLSNEYSGLISFRMDWLDLLAVQGLSRVFSSTIIQKHQFFGS